MLLLFYEVTSGMCIKKVWEYFKKGQNGPMKDFQKLKLVFLM